MDGEAKFQLEVIEIKLKLFSREVYEFLALRVPPPHPPLTMGPRLIISDQNVLIELAHLGIAS